MIIELLFIKLLPKKMLKFISINRLANVCQLIRFWRGDIQVSVAFDQLNVKISMLTYKVVIRQRRICAREQSVYTSRGLE